jgi:hypothetical protein
MPHPTNITSPLRVPFTESGITVDVRIYRLQDTKWSLEVIDSSGTSTVWDDPFDTDEAAKAEFLRAISTIAADTIDSTSASARSILSTWDTGVTGAPWVEYRSRNSANCSPPCAIGCQHIG